MKHCDPLKLDIELYFTGELDKKESATLENHLKECTVCHDYLQSLRRERNEFLADHPFSAFKNEKAVNFSIPWYQKLFDILARPALIPVYGLLLIISVSVPVFFFGNGIQAVDEIRFKGTARLNFLYQRDGVIHEGDRKKAYRAGDLIQILYNSSQEQYVALLSIDSKGQLSFYHPEQSSSLCTVKSAAGTGLTFPGSIILDDSEGGELVILLFSGEPLPVEAVRQWVSALYSKHQGITELEQVIIKKKLKQVSLVSTLLLHKE